MNFAKAFSSIQSLKIESWEIYCLLHLQEQHLMAQEPDFVARKRLVDEINEVIARSFLRVGSRDISLFVGTEILELHKKN
jgi:hypothetical protein